uniref:Uncharacterized protein n=1 Tax=Helianthus annuus TaxID=4232 RepID=A0A251TRN5_HELAN
MVVHMYVREGLGREIGYGAREESERRWRSTAVAFFPNSIGFRHAIHRHRHRRVSTSDA